MTKPVALDYELHKHMRVITRRGAEFGENVHFLPVVADEMRNLALEYPVCLIKDEETGQFDLQVLLGFEPGENLFLDGDNWDASYVPLHIQRQPFIAGFDVDERTQAITMIDMDSKRVQDSRGEALFHDDGSPSEFLNQRIQLLSQLMSGVEATRAFISALADLDLIEAASIKVSFANGEEKSYAGIYSINEDNLSSLSGDELSDLNLKGYLEVCYLMTASLGQIKKLVREKNRRLAVIEHQ